MNRAFLVPLLILGLVAGVCVAAHADEIEGERVKPVSTGPLARAIRGAWNMIISPIEIPATVRRVSAERDPFFGIWAGALEGFGNGIVRFGAGAVELVTAPLPFHYLPLYNKRLGERAMPPARPPTGVTRP